MTAKRPSAEEIASVHAGLLRLATSHWAASALHAAVRLGLFATLESSPKQLEQLARELRCKPHPLKMLLGVMGALGLVEARDGQFACSAVARTFLVPGGSFYQGDLVNHLANSTVSWQQLEMGIRDGDSSSPPLSGRPDPREGLRNEAAVLGPVLAQRLDLRRVQRLLYAGGNTAGYAIALALHKADLRVDLLDLPEGRQEAEAAAQTAKLGERVRYLEGGVLTCELEAQAYDMVIYSNLLASCSQDTCRTLLSRAFGALGAEAPCVVHDRILSDNHLGPLPSTLHALQVWLDTGTSGGHSGWEYTDMMQGVGFIRLQLEPLEPSQYSLVMGFHP